MAIAERRQRLEMTISIIANAERVREEGDKARVEDDFPSALGKYKLALNIYDAVHDEFKPQLQAAEEGKRTVNQSITGVIEDIFERAREAIEEGDRLQEQHNYDGAVASYQRVPDIVAVIPEDAKPNQLKDKQDIITLSQNKIDEAKQAKMRYEAAQQQQGGAPAAPGGAAAPAPGG